MDLQRGENEGKWNEENNRGGRGKITCLWKIWGVLENTPICISPFYDMTWISFPWNHKSVICGKIRLLRGGKVRKREEGGRGGKSKGESNKKGENKSIWP